VSITEGLALGSASSFVLTVIYLHGYALTLGVDLFSYFSLNDYFRLAIEWLPGFLAAFSVGALLDKVFTRLEGGKLRTAAAMKHQQAQIMMIIGIAVLSTIVSFVIPYPREQVYSAWAIAGPLIWLISVGWYIQEPKVVQNWTKPWLLTLTWFPAFAITAFFLGLTAGQKAAHSNNRTSDVKIVLRSAQTPAAGTVLFRLDDYILVRSENAGITAFPKDEVVEIVHRDAKSNGKTTAAK